MTNQFPDATKKVLSPAASIVKAFDDRYELLSGLEENWQEDCLAAALRAAAPMMECVQDHLKLLAIAAELGGITPAES
jgi:hypothetical protein